MTSFSEQGWEEVAENPSWRGVGAEGGVTMNEPRLQMTSSTCSIVLSDLTYKTNFKVLTTEHYKHGAPYWGWCPVQLQRSHTRKADTK